VQHATRAVHAIVQIHDGRFPCLPAADGEQLLGQRRRKLRGVADAGQIGRARIARSDVVRKLLGVTENRGQ